MPVWYSSSVDHVSLLAEEDIFAFLPLDVNLHEEITREYTLFEKSLDAPVEEGRQIGEMVIYSGGQRIASVALVAKNAVYRSTGLWIWGKVKKVLFGIGGIVAAIAIIFIAVLVIFANAYMRARRERR